MDRLLEREGELTALSDALAAAREGDGRIVLIEGPAGIGKTSLLEATRRLARTEMRTLHARGTELEREFAMGVARQCLGPTVLDEGEREALLSGAARHAAPVLLDGAGPDGPALGGVLHGMFWLVANLSRSGPVLIAVDDVQWADEASLRFLAYLGRRIEGLPVALVVARRTEPDDVPPAPVAELGKESACVRLEPQALAAEAVAQLLAQADAEVDASFAQACHRASGGNPFLLGELVQTLRDERVPFTATAASRVEDVTPPAVVRAVSAALQRAGDDAQALARAAAVLGEGAALAQAAELAGLASPTAAAEALSEAGLLDGSQRLRFRHPLVAGAVRSGIPALTRAGMHAQAAALLRAHGAPTDRVALHLLHAPPASTARAVDELRTAAALALRRGAPEAACALLERALAEPPAADLRARLLLELGGAELATGRTDASRSHLEEALRTATDPLTAAEAVAQLSQANPGDPETRRRVVALVRDACSDVPGEERELLLRLRSVLALEGGYDEGDALPGDTPGEAMVLGSAIFARMRPDATADEIADLAWRAARQTDALLAEPLQPIALTGIVLGLRWVEQLDDAQRLLDRALDVARARGSALDFGTALTLRAFVHRTAGRLREAEADARTAFEAMLDTEWFFARGTAPLVHTLIDAGRVAEARAELEGPDLLDRVPYSPPMIPVVLARMALHAAERKPEQVVADWADALARMAAFGRVVNASWIEDIGVAADAFRALGDHATAEERLREMEQIATCWGTAGVRGQALFARARGADGDAAIELLEEAGRALADSPLRLDHARALVALGGALRRSGRRTDGRGPLREGHELAVACGATALAETARAELRASGVRLRREALSGAESLTPSEHRIASMAAGGLSNAEIAQELFLTVKTVEMHLTHAYRKLDIGGRRDLPGALAAPKP